MVNKFGVGSAKNNLLSLLEINFQSILSGLLNDITKLISEISLSQTVEAD